MGVLDGYDAVLCVYYDIEGVSTCIRCRRHEEPTEKLRKCLDSTEGFNPPPVDYKPKDISFTVRRPRRKLRQLVSDLLALIGALGRGRT